MCSCGHTIGGHYAEPFCPACDGDEPCDMSFTAWLAAHDERVRNEALVPVLDLADHWRKTLPIQFRAGRRVIDDIDVDDLVLDLLDVAASNDPTVDWESAS